MMEKITNYVFFIYLFVNLTCSSLVMDFVYLKYSEMTSRIQLFIFFYLKVRWTINLYYPLIMIKFISQLDIFYVVKLDKYS